jgi:hypothetical protein
MGNLKTEIHFLEKKKKKGGRMRYIIEGLILKGKIINGVGWNNLED